MSVCWYGHWFEWEEPSRCNNGKTESTHPEKVTIWCPLWCEGVIGTYFFENIDSTTLTLNSECYVHMITDTNKMVAHARCHTTRANMTEIPLNMYQKVVENYLNSINACNTSRGAVYNKKEISWTKIFCMRFIYVYFWNH